MVQRRRTGTGTRGVFGGTRPVSPSVKRALTRRKARRGGTPSTSTIDQQVMVERAGLTATVTPSGFRVTPEQAVLTRARQQRRVEHRIIRQAERTPVIIKKRIEPPPSEVRALQEPEGRIAPLLFRAQLKAEEFFTRRQRQEARGEVLGAFKSSLAEFGIGAGTTVLATGVFAERLVTSPKQTAVETVKAIPTVPAKIIEFGSKTLEQRPAYATGVIAGEIATIKATSFALKKLKIGQAVEKVATPRSPAYKKVKEGVLKLDDVDVRITTTYKGEPIRRQVKLAGKKIDAISGARDFFKRFDDETLVAKQGKDLEKSFFLSPPIKKTGELTLRKKRLGIGIGDPPEAKIIDILSGDVKLLAERKQGILIRNLEVEAFPKSLKKVEAKLLRGGTLTSAEKRRLLKFQLKPSGKAKPVGFISSEPEVTIAPSEIITKKKLEAVTLIDDEKVFIYEAEIKKASPKLAKLRTKQATGVKLSAQELGDVAKLTAKETGISPIHLTKRYSPSRIVAKSSRIIIPRRISSPIRSPVSPSRISSVASPIRISRISRITKARSPIRPSRIRQPIYAYSPVRAPPRIMRVARPLLPIRDTRITRKRIAPPKIRKQDVALPEGFTARVLQFKPIEIKASDIKFYGEPVGIRRAPILIR